MARKKTKTKQVSIYFTDRQYDAIERMAQDIGIGRSIVIQIAVDAFFQNDVLYKSSSNDLDDLT